VQVEAQYPVSTKETKQTVVALAWLTTSIDRQDELLALQLLDAILMATDASILKKALLSSGLCEDAFSSLDAEMSETPWIFQWQGCEETIDPHQLKSLTLATLEPYRSSPFPEEAIEACLHQIEFERKEIDGHGSPFGLTLFFRAGLLQQQGGDPQDVLSTETLFQHLKEHLKKPLYLNHLLERYLLDNPHSVLLTLRGSFLLQQEELDDEKEELRQLGHRLSELEKKIILSTQQTLKDHQIRSSSLSPDCLPILPLSYIPSHPTSFTLSPQHQDSYSYWHHEAVTNHITYADYLLPIQLHSLDEEALAPLSFLVKIVDELGTQVCSYEQTLLHYQTHLGDIGANMTLFSSIQQPLELQSYLTLKASALDNQRPYLFEALMNLYRNLDLSDRVRIRDLLKQHTSSLKARLPQKAMQYATLRALGSLSPLHQIQNQMKGLPYYQRLLQGDKDHSWGHHLDALYQIISSTETGALIITSQGKAPTPPLNCLPSNCAQFGSKRNLLVHNPTYEAQVTFIATPLAYTVSAMNAPPLQDLSAFAYFLLAELIEVQTLHPKIREEGGAYGSGASYYPLSGLFSLHAYRDPHLARTLQVFNQSLDRVAEGRITAKELDEAKRSVFQTLDAPISVAQRGWAALTWQITGQDYEVRSALRARLLQATIDDLTKAALQLRTSPKTISTFTNRKLFDEKKGDYPFQVVDL
jgi:hypothetical protein